MIANDGGRLDPHPPVFYPDLMPGMPPSVSMFNAEPVTRWPPLIDIDQLTLFSIWNERIGGQFK